VGAKVLGVVVVGVPTGRRGYGYYYRGYYSDGPSDDEASPRGVG